MSPSGQCIRVLIADDHPLMRDGLRSMLQPVSGLKVVAEAADGAECLAKFREHRPDVALLDIGMPGADGLSAAAELSRLLPDCGLVVLTSLETPDNRRRAAAAGVSGFLLKGVPAATLIGAVRSAAWQAGSRRPG